MKFYPIREVRLKERTQPLHRENEKEQPCSDEMQTLALPRQEGTVWMNAEQRHARAKESRRELAVVWFYRWSQVLMGIFFLTAAALFLTGILAPQLLDTDGKQIALYIALGASCTGAGICFVINGSICQINERMVERHARQRASKNYSCRESNHQ